MPSMRFTRIYFYSFQKCLLLVACFAFFLCISFVLRCASNFIFSTHAHFRCQKTFYWWQNTEQRNLYVRAFWICESMLGVEHEHTHARTSMYSRIVFTRYISGKVIYFGVKMDWTWLTSLRWSALCIKPKTNYLAWCHIDIVNWKCGTATWWIVMSLRISTIAFEQLQSMILLILLLRVMSNFFLRFHDEKWDRSKMCHVWKFNVSPSGWKAFQPPRSDRSDHLALATRNILHTNPHTWCCFSVGIKAACAHPSYISKQISRINNRN